MKHSKQHKEKLSKSHKERMSNMTEEEKKAWLSKRKGFNKRSSTIEELDSLKEFDEQ